MTLLWAIPAYFAIAFSLGLYFGFITFYSSLRPDTDSFPASSFASYDFYYAPCVFSHNLFFLLEMSVFSNLFGSERISFLE
jgi:hypothetical protein